MRKLFSVFMLFAAVSAPLLGCSGEFPSDPSFLTVESSGGDQRGTMGMELQSPLRLRVLDHRGEPRAGVRVTWQVTAGGGSATPAEARTDATGEAVTRWTLGLVAGPHTVTATVDGAPQATFSAQALVLEGVQDHGVVLRHGDGPKQSDIYGARDVWVWEWNGTYYMHYDAAGPTGWLATLATSKDLIRWEKKGPVLELGEPGQLDSQSASYGVTYHDGSEWHMFYLGAQVTSPAPDHVPMYPYVTLKARASSPSGPWVKQKAVLPFLPTPGTYYSAIASPGHVIQHQGEYLQFFSSTVIRDQVPLRTLGIARTRDLNGSWKVDPEPILPVEEQIENASLYYEPANQTWFLFTNHVAMDQSGREYTDAIWVYWSKDLNRWDPRSKAMVLDGRGSTWSKRIIGLPSVVRAGDRLAILYDGLAGHDLPAGNKVHMKRDVGLAWVALPLMPPQ